MRGRSAVWAGLVAVAAALLAGEGARAESNLSLPPYGTTRLTAVPVGAWSRYKTAYFAGNSAQDVDIALVARAGGKATWQSTFTGVNQTHIVNQTIARIVGDTPKAVLADVVQWGKAQAFQVRVPEGETKAPFRTFDRKNLVGAETVVVPAGRFACQHYSDTENAGHGYDFWVSERVLPTAIVRFEE